MLYMMGCAPHKNSQDESMAFDVSCLFSLSFSRPLLLLLLRYSSSMPSIHSYTRSMLYILIPHPPLLPFLSPTHHRSRK
jgi:hypothetical protein